MNKLKHLVRHSNPVRRHYYLHFIDESSEAQREQATCPFTQLDSLGGRI